MEFLNKLKDTKEKNPIYTIRDKQRELREFKMSLELKPLAELWRDQCLKSTKYVGRSIEEYRDFLGIMKGLIGNDSPLITKFEVLLNKFEHSHKVYCDLVNKSIDNTLEKGMIELKSKEKSKDNE